MHAPPHSGFPVHASLSNQGHWSSFPRLLKCLRAWFVCCCCFSTKTRPPQTAGFFEGDGVPLEFFAKNSRSFNGVYLETSVLRKAIQASLAPTLALSHP